MLWMTAPNGLSFRSTSVAKDPEGKYVAKIKFKNQDGTLIDRQYKGTRQDVLDAIEAGKELPDDQNKQLLRSLDDQDRWQFDFPIFPNWGKELFSWPIDPSQLQPLLVGTSADLEVGFKAFVPRWFGRSRRRAERRKAVSERLSRSRITRSTSVTRLRSGLSIARQIPRPS